MIKSKIAKNISDNQKNDSRNTLNQGFLTLSGATQVTEISETLSFDQILLSFGGKSLGFEGKRLGFVQKFSNFKIKVRDFTKNINFWHNLLLVHTLIQF